MEPITDEIKEAFYFNKCNINVMRVGYTILDAAAESGIDKIGAFSTINQHTMPSSMENICQTSEMLLTEKISMFPLQSRSNLHKQNV